MSIDASARLRWIQAGLVGGVIVLLIALLLPAVQQAREAARRSMLKYELQQIGLAIGNYHDSYRILPHGGIFNEEGTAFHGWTTALLLYLSQRANYDTPDRNFPWDDSANIDKFIRETTHPWQIPDISEVRSPDGLPLTHFAANQSLFHRNSVVNLDSLPERSSVALVGEVRGAFVPIGYPYNWRDLTLGLGKAEHGFGSPIHNGTTFVMVDLSVREFSDQIHPDILQALAGPKAIQPTPELVAKPAGPYRLTIREYWRYLNVVRAHKGLLSFRLSPDRTKLFVDFREYDDPVDATPERWNPYFQKFLQAGMPRSNLWSRGHIRAHELQPFLDLPNLKRLTISTARIEDDPKELLEVVRNRILID